MATKEEHLAELVSDHFKEHDEMNRYMLGVHAALAEARAERDAALANTGSKQRDELECKVREALGEAMPFAEYTDDQVAGFVREVVAERDALKTRPLAVLPSYAIDSIRAMDGEHGRYVEATIGLPREGGDLDWYELTSAQPSPAPVVGGVTEAHLDELFAIAVNRVESPAYMLVRDWIDRARAAIRAQKPERSLGGVCEEMLDRLGNIFAKHGLTTELEKPVAEWMTAARAARRAQKRVDVEAIREVACAPFVSPELGNKLLRAIGDVPPEAPSAPQAEGFSIKRGDTFTAPFVNLSRAPQAEPPKVHGIPIYLDPTCPPDKLYFARSSKVEPGAITPTSKNTFAKIEDIGESTPPEATSAPVEAPVIMHATPMPPPEASFDYGEPAPAEAEGPFAREGRYIRRDADDWLRIVDTLPADWADEALRLLNLGLAAEQGKLPKPPATRDEKLVALVDLAADLGDNQTVWDNSIQASLRATRDEIAMLRAHLAKKQEAKS